MQKQFSGGRTIFSTNGVGWISRVKKKKEKNPTQSRFYTLHRKSLQVDHTLKRTMQSYETFRKVHKRKSSGTRAKVLRLDTTSTIQINTLDFIKVKILAVQKTMLRN